ncbi:MAG: hypothetical protein BYD32DRAFT_196745 [Podila humilis]|nr:MAG: hypothetical protein BYD32DRAFT_196745 [Podila humilis]
MGGTPWGCFFFCFFFCWPGDRAGHRAKEVTEVRYVSTRQLMQRVLVLLREPCHSCRAIMIIRATPPSHLLASSHPHIDILTPFVYPLLD